MARRSVKLTPLEFAAVLLILCVLAGVLLPALSRSREASFRASCQNNLKQLGVVMKMFAAEHNGHFPPLSPIPDNWTMDMAAVYPEYLSDLAVLVCPSSPFAHTDAFQQPECVSSLFYVYTGYGIFCDEQAAAFYAAYADRREDLLHAPSLQLAVPVWPDSDRIHHPGQTGMPVMWDRIPLAEHEFSHEPNGANVLHMDGHVQFVPYSVYNTSNYFPITRLSAETFGAVLPRLPAHCPG